MNINNEISTQKLKDAGSQYKVIDSDNAMTAIDNIDNRLSDIVIDGNSDLPAVVKAIKDIINKFGGQQ